MCIEVATAAVSQDSLAAMFRHPANALDRDASLVVPLQKMLVAASRRLLADATSPILPRLLESLHRFYHTLQKGDSRVNLHSVLDVCASISGDSSQQEISLLITNHLTSLTVPLEGTHEGKLRQGKSMLPLLPRHMASISLNTLSSYPVLPPSQPFAEIRRNLTDLAPNMAALAVDLEEAPPPLALALTESRWAALGLGEEG